MAVFYSHWIYFEIGYHVANICNSRPEYKNLGRGSHPKVLRVNCVAGYALDELSRAVSSYPGTDCSLLLHLHEGRLGAGIAIACDTNREPP